MKKSKTNTLSDTIERVTINAVNDTRFCLSSHQQPLLKNKQLGKRKLVWQSLPNGNPSSSKVLLNMFSPAREKTNRLLNCKQFSKTTTTAPGNMK